jgi:predicted RNase H-like HicB family nuclease
VLERGEHGAIGVWFPDFPGFAAGGRSQEEAMARAADVLADALRTAAERSEALPEPTSIRDIALPEGCDFVGLVAVGASPPDPSERVNVYLPKSLIERIDRLAEELGMNRSSFFGMAASDAIARHSRFGLGPFRSAFGPTSRRGGDR